MALLTLHIYGKGPSCRAQGEYPQEECHPNLPCDPETHLQQPKCVFVVHLLFLSEINIIRHPKIQKCCLKRKSKQKSFLKKTLSCVCN